MPGYDGAGVILTEAAFNGVWTAGWRRDHEKEAMQPSAGILAIRIPETATADRGVRGGRAGVRGGKFARRAADPGAAGRHHHRRRLDVRLSPVLQDVLRVPRVASERAGELPIDRQRGRAATALRGHREL